MWKHLFLPHPQTHKKAHLLSLPALLSYIAFFLLLQGSFLFLNRTQPGVLGISSSITKEDIIHLTNVEREKLGISDLKENSELDAAAYEKAQNMFSENYWAHYSPSGKSPWDFITGAGYKFSYAGENLARNFYNSPDVVQAWMNSPSHRDNMVNIHYQDIGVAVVSGNLLGQDTVLVVQEFGAPAEAIAQVPQLPPAQPKAISLEQTQIPKTVNNQPLSYAQSATNVLPSSVIVDPYSVTRGFGISIVTLIMILLLLDMYIIRRRGVVRLGFSHVPHLSFLIVVICSLVLIHPGGIL